MKIIYPLTVFLFLWNFTLLAENYKEKKEENDTVAAKKVCMSKYENLVDIFLKIDSVSHLNKTYLIPSILSKETLPKNHMRFGKMRFTFVHKDDTWKQKYGAYQWADRIKTYESIGQAYIDINYLDSASHYINKISILNPEYFHINTSSDKTILLPRYTSIKLTAGFTGWGTLMIPSYRNTENEYQPEGALNYDERLSVFNTNLQSSLFIGFELIHNAVNKKLKKSIIRSFDLYFEYFSHVTRFHHYHTTQFSPESGKPEKVENDILENQDWGSFLIYPRIRLSPFNDNRWTVQFYAGGGISKLKSAHFFQIFQSINNAEPKEELSPLRLDTKEQMRKISNTSWVVGTGLTYLISKTLNLTIDLRYLSMVNNLVTENTLVEKPLQNEPLYYADNKLFIQQISIGVGVSINLGLIHF
jgi:hypothetical protein